MSKSDNDSGGSERDEELYEELSRRVDEREGETCDPQACLATVESLAENLRKAGWGNNHTQDTDT